MTEPTDGFLIENTKLNDGEDTLPREQFTILIVDDVKQNLMLLEDMLQEEHRVILKADSGVKALQIAMENPDIGLIMLDVQMPGMDGYEVAQLLSINPKTKSIPFLFVTASEVLDANILKGFKTGAIDYLIKPLNPTLTRSKVAVFENLHFYQRRLKGMIIEREEINQQLERYTRVIAHDLKTPLAGIIGLISLIKMNDKVQDIDGLIEELNMLEELSTNLSNMITTVLEDSRKGASTKHIEEISVEHLVRGCIAVLQAPNSVRFRLDSSLPILKTNKITLHQVFQNLIGNAIKYNDKADGLISIGFEDAGEFVKFHVSDNGPGIEKEDALAIFEAFSIGKASSRLDSSTGLGLHFVKNAVEEQGGKVWVESRPRLGSTFYFLWKKSL